MKNSRSRDFDQPPPPPVVNPGICTFYPDKSEQPTEKGGGGIQLDLEGTIIACKAGFSEFNYTLVHGIFLNRDLNRGARGNTVRSGIVFSTITIRYRDNRRAIIRLLYKNRKNYPRLEVFWPHSNTKLHLKLKLLSSQVVISTTYLH